MRRDANANYSTGTNLLAKARVKREITLDLAIKQPTPRFEQLRH